MGLFDHWPWLVLPAVLGFLLWAVARHAGRYENRRYHYLIWGLLFIPAAVNLGTIVFLVWFQWGFAGVFRSAETFVLVFAVIWSIHVIWTLKTLRS